ncbi:diacylglycerol kinase family protein [Sphingobacterium griseoflavum]|uniref:Undecaprenol kinase n=1 Tax=Sphingobacterium griseoflavum TaxID=1474952 RepID=A0ABQ3HT93_9SPHI|nr:diacylglycerol kinase family protein [Sphingobacterium griseoflavum]GHE23435.1 undecaprenol kinase [Sphingobacterium griseoflavum]
MKKKKITLISRLQSLKYAYHGLKTVFSEEPNAKIHLAVAFLVTVAGIYFQIAIQEWIALCLCIAFVITMELLNTSIEHLADAASPTWHPLVKKAKDIAAAAVLVSATAAILIGLAIFIPKI